MLSLVIAVTSFIAMAEGTGHSFQSVFTECVFRVLMISKRDRQRSYSIEALERTHLKKNRDYKVSKAIIDIFRLDKYEIDGFEVLVFNEDAQSGKYIFYLHGGAFTEQPLIFHYGFLDQLARETDSTVIMPVYPKAPTYTYQTTIQMVVNTYIDMLSRINSNDIFIMGDSAGAAMAISVCQYLAQNDILMPKEMIIFSPCVDGTLKNPDIALYEDRDLMLAKNILEVKILSYAGSEENLTDYLVSPIYGPLDCLPPTAIFVGSEEILLPDIRLFVEKAKEQGADITCFEYRDMQHVFPLYPTPEGKETRKFVQEILLK